MILTTGCNQWERGLDVVVEGEAIQVTDEGVLERLAEAWATKWDGRWHYEVHERAFRHEGGTGAVWCSRSRPPRSSRSPRERSARHGTGSEFLHSLHKRDRDVCVRTT